MRDRQALGLRLIGADDDPDYEVRRGIERSKAAERARRYRAAHGTGAKRGRQALQLSPEDKLARRRTQGAKRVARAANLTPATVMGKFSRTRLPEISKNQERHSIRQ